MKTCHYLLTPMSFETPYLSPWNTNSKFFPYNETDVLSFGYAM